MFPPYRSMFACSRSHVPILKSLNLVECPEFRRLLLLLRNDLSEAMIPHRTKLRDLIIQAWRQYFQDLRRNLDVCLLSLLHAPVFILLTRHRWDKFLLLRTYGLIKIADRS